MLQYVTMGGHYSKRCRMLDTGLDWTQLDTVLPHTTHNCDQDIFVVLSHVMKAAEYILNSRLQSSTVGSRLSEPRLSVSAHLDDGSHRHVFGTHRKKTMRSLEFCYRRKQSCCTNDFPNATTLFPCNMGLRSQFATFELAERASAKSQML